MNVAKWDAEKSMDGNFQCIVDFESATRPQKFMLGSCLGTFVANMGIWGDGVSGHDQPTAPLTTTRLSSAPLDPAAGRQVGIACEAASPRCIVSSQWRCLFFAGLVCQRFGIADSRHMQIAVLRNMWA